MIIMDDMQVLGRDNTLAYEPWPQHDEALLVEDKVNLPIQVQCHTQYAIMYMYLRNKKGHVKREQMKSVCYQAL